MIKILTKSVKRACIKTKRTEKCKGPEVGVCVVSLQKQQESFVARKE